MSPDNIMRIVSIIILGMIVLIFFTINLKSTGIDIIDYPLRDFYHADMSHLFANGISMVALSFMEEILGWKQYLFAIIFIWISSSMILLLIHKLIPSRKITTVGFSGVIFGLMVIYYKLLGASSGITMIGLLISIVPQLMVPGISFEGHLSGIIAGIIYVSIFPIKNTDQSVIQSARKRF